MKAFLMYENRDFDAQKPLPWNAEALTQDLELNTLFSAMACNDKFLFEIARSAILSNFQNDIGTILYRQEVLNDCIRNSAVVRAIYDLSVETLEKKKREFWWSLGRYAGSILYSSRELMQMLVTMLSKLRDIAEEHSTSFSSPGFTRFFSMLMRELDDEYFAIVRGHLNELKFRNGVLISAQLGKGNKGDNYVLRAPKDRDQGWMERLFAQRPAVYTIHIAPRDEAGTKAASDLRDRGINLVANALAQSAEHVLSFFSMLQTELAFYVGCLNLHERILKKGEPICFPSTAISLERTHSFQGLYDICLSLRKKERVIGNDVNADGKDLVIITGANTGGKSTFLRSIGSAQLMMQCGMFTPAESFSANVCNGIFTHYKREEDVSMQCGKLDEELSRMSEIADHITPGSLLLFNESFSATNEREGSEIAKQIMDALLEKRVKIFCVTHLYESAHGYFERHMGNTLFLRAGRQSDKARTFKLSQGEPLQTSYGPDLYEEIFSSGN